VTGSTRRRFRQGWSGLRSTLPADYEEVVGRLPSPIRSAFETLPTFDRAHLCAVCRWLHDRGETDDDLLTAALLHDLGKTAAGGRLTLIDRILNVLLANAAPSVLQRLAELPATGWRQGIALAVHHPQLGASRARELGCSERACWLVAHHADDPLPDDAQLRLLIEADRRA
jgi:hypothetical protein